MTGARRGTAASAAAWAGESPGIAVDSTAAAVWLLRPEVGYPQPNPSEVTIVRLRGSCGAIDIPVEPARQLLDEFKRRGLPLGPVIWDRYMCTAQVPLSAPRPTLAATFAAEPHTDGLRRLRYLPPGSMLGLPGPGATPVSRLHWLIEPSPKGPLTDPAHLATMLRAICYFDQPAQQPNTLDNTR